MISKHCYDLWVTMVLMGRINQCLEWSFDDVILRTIVVQYGSMEDVDPCSIRRVGGVSHHVSSKN